MATGMGDEIGAAMMAAEHACDRLRDLREAPEGECGERFRAATEACALADAKALAAAETVGGPEAGLLRRAATMFRRAIPEVVAWIAEGEGDGLATASSAAGLVDAAFWSLEARGALREARDGGVRSVKACVALRALAETFPECDLPGRAALIGVMRIVDARERATDADLEEFEAVVAAAA